MSTILGIDPGSRYTGCGLVSFDGSQIKHEQHSVISIPSKYPLWSKLAYLKDELDKVLCDLKPDQVVVEKIFLGKNIDSVFKLGHVRGVCLMLASSHKAEVFEYAARKVKKLVTGSGGATKEHTAFVVKQILNLSSDIPLDASDALALAISHCQVTFASAKLERQAKRESI